LKANYQQGCFDLEKVQLEDGRIGTKVASHDSIYFERGWELFSALLFIQPMERRIMIMFRFVEPNSSSMKIYNEFLMSIPVSK
jgi:hypothetical protein